MRLYVFEDTRKIANCFGVVAASRKEADGYMHKMGESNYKLIAEYGLDDSFTYRKGVDFMVEE
jgi:hypothetical protein